MKGATHIAGGAVAGLALTAVLDLNATQAITATACTMVGSLLPDIDICTSKAGRTIAPASFLIQLFIGHRTLFHAPLLYILLYAAAAKLFPEHIFVAGAALIGVASHLLLDMLNPAGVPLLWPVPKKIHVARFQSGGIFDWLLCGILTVWAGILLYRLLGAAA